MTAKKGGGSTSGSDAVIDVVKLHVATPSRAIVRGVSLHVRAGECVAIVGESGSGKSVTARALLGLAGKGVRTSAERLAINGQDHRNATERQWERVRGREIGLILQDALVSLDPLRPIGREIEDPLRLHERMSAAERQKRVLDLLASVGMPEPELAARQRSGELSGGLRQRALIAAGIALEPPVLIADEPTTALDVSIQARILALLSQIRSRGTGLLLISHDLAVVSELADRILVMHDGAFVDEGTPAEVLSRPRHPRTRALIAAVPTDRPRGQALSIDAQSDHPGAGGRSPDLVDVGTTVPISEPGATPVLCVDRVAKEFRSLSGRQVRAVDDVSITLFSGETLGLVGESGSGKTTLARLVLALESVDAGGITLNGGEWAGLSERARRPLRSRIGAVYQDPLSSFDPRWSVEQILNDAATSASDGIVALLDQVGLNADVARRRPLTLSGGQRQRVAIARALAARPDILICDEPVSALDVTVQAQILDLIDRVQRERGLACLFISHDLGVVRHMSDRVAVMRDGRIVETGVTEDVFERPKDPYTARLIADSPRLRTQHTGPGAFPAWVS